MKYLKIKLYLIPIILLYNHFCYAQHELSSIFIETPSGGISEVCHETHLHGGTRYQNTAFRPTPNGKAAFLRNNGLFELGSVDVCLRNYSSDTYLAVEGGSFSWDSGFWRVASDFRLKKNITPATSSLQKLMRVKLYDYEYKRGGRVKMGILAQEIKDIFPNSVHTFTVEGEEYYSVDYNDMFFANLGATQEVAQKTLEQEAQIKELEQENQRLRAELEVERNKNEQQEMRMAAIEAALGIQNDVTVQAIEASPKPVTSSINIITTRERPRLEPCIPNPFTQSTTIPYYLPEGTRNAVLSIHDIAGKIVAEHTLLPEKGEGKIQVNVDDAQLNGGIYTYSLYVNNRLIDTKRMTLLTK